MPSDPVELTKQIKAACDIVAIVGGYLKLTPAGRTFKALCPFHNDSRPSLDVDPRLQRYRCWSCQAHGDVFSFVQHMEKVGFREARQILAARAGIKLDEAASPQDQARTRLLGVMRWAQDRYHRFLLDDPAAEPARKYLGGRKLSGKTVRDFGLGYAPLGGDWLVGAAVAEGIPADVLAEVGLIAARMEGRGHYDRFRDRVMFPIRDVQARPVGFGGRIMPESPLLPRAPKYYNSSETPLFSKSDILYGLDLARHAGAAVGYLAVVEGYTDVMMAHQCGVPQVVATMGTALTARHVRQLSRFVRKVVLVFDADGAGEKAWNRGMTELLAHLDIEVAVAKLPPGLDPCDLLLRPGGVDAFKAALDGAVDALDFRLDWLLERNDSPGVEATRRIVDDVLGVLAALPFAQSRATQVKQELIVTRLARRLGLRHETVWARLSELRNDHRKKRDQADRPGPLVQASAARTTAPADNERKPKRGPAEACELQLLELVLASPWLVPTAAAAVSPEELTHTGLRRILAELSSIQAAGTTPDMDALRERLHDRPDLFDSALKLQFVGQQMGRESDERLEWLHRVLKRFTELKVEAERRAVREQLGAGTADEGAAVELLRRLQQAGRKPTPGGADR